MRPHCFYYANQVVLMLTRLYLHNKSKEYQSKVNSSLACTRGQVTKHTTVKWPINNINIDNNLFFLILLAVHPK